MGMAYSNGYEKKRPERSNHMNWCPDCSAEFTGNANDWIKVMDVSKGTETPRYVKVSDIQKDVCICCDSKNIQGPIKL